MKKKIKLLYCLLPLSAVCIAPVAFLNTSCSNYSDTIDKKLKEESIPWYTSLSNKPFSPNNLFCESETQAINLYANHWGYFWNQPLHLQQEPQNFIYSGKEIRGSDWHYLKEALDKSIFPEDKIVYHGVEYQEVEFYNQLKDFIVQKPDGSYDYSGCIGKTIESYGFISTTLDEWRIENYCNGEIFWGATSSLNGLEISNQNQQYNTNIQRKSFRQGRYLPLKEPAAFEIKIPKGYKGVAYLSDFSFSGQVNYENQVLINRLCRFLINGVKKNSNGVNIFYVDLVDPTVNNNNNNTSTIIPDPIPNQPKQNKKKIKNNLCII